MELTTDKVITGLISLVGFAILFYTIVDVFLAEKRKRENRKEDLQKIRDMLLTLTDLKSKQEWALIFDEMHAFLNSDDVERDLFGDHHLKELKKRIAEYLLSENLEQKLAWSRLMRGLVHYMDCDNDFILGLREIYPNEPLMKELLIENGLAAQAVA